MDDELRLAELMESRQVGPTRYLRGYDPNGTEVVYAVRESGDTEFVCSDETGSVRAAFTQLTGSSAPTELGEQMRAEDELNRRTPEWDDPEVQLDHDRLDYEDQVAGIHEDLAEGRISQSEHDAQLAASEEHGQRLEDRQAVAEMEHADADAQHQTLDRYDQELAAEGMSAEQLGTNDWAPQADDFDNDIDM